MTFPNIKRNSPMSPAKLPPADGPIIFDIETGPEPVDRLRKLF